MMTRTVRRILCHHAVVALLSTAAWAQTALPSLSPVPLSYNAISDLVPRPRPPLPRMGPAGYSFADPVFGSRILRVTDAGTIPQLSHIRCNTASGGEQNQFNTNSTIFYVRCGPILLFRLNQEQFTASVIKDPANPSVPLRLPAGEPEFSHTDPNILYFATGNTIREYNIAGNRMTTLLDLQTAVRSVVTGVAGQISASANERIAVAFNGYQQSWRNVAVYDRRAGTHTIIDTVNATIDGQPLNMNVSFGLHNVRIDKTGRYLALTPGQIHTSATAYGIYMLDLVERKIARVEYRFGGHRAFGYGYVVNGDVLAGDAGPSMLGRPADLSLMNNAQYVRGLMPGLNPKPYIGGVDYMSWNNARPGVMTPVASFFFQTFYGANKFDGEILMAATDGSARVWRFAHHRSVPASNGDFWGWGRGSVSPDGKYFLFSSNWERTLGTVGDGLRTDVFLVSLEGRSALNEADLRSITLDTASLTFGGTATATVELTTAAAQGGQVVSLSTASRDLNVPGSVTVPAGATRASFKVSLFRNVSQSTQAAIVAGAGTVTRSAALTLQPAGLDVVSLRPVAYVMGGSSFQVFAQLAAPAPDAGGTVSVTSSDPSVAAVPGVVSVSGSSTGVYVPVTTSLVSSPRSVRISVSGISGPRSTDVSILPVMLRSVVFPSSTIRLGATLNTWIGLHAPAPNDIRLVLENPCGLQGLLQAPIIITIPKGWTGTNVPIKATRVVPGTVCTVSASGPYNRVSASVTLAQ